MISSGFEPCGAVSTLTVVLADCLIDIFAMDSAITRTLQLHAEAGAAKADIATAMTQLFCAGAHQRVFDRLREMLMWMSEEAAWQKEIKDVNSYHELSRVNTFSLRRKVDAQEIADTVIWLCSEAGRSVSGRSIGVCGNVETMRRG